MSPRKLILLVLVVNFHLIARSTTFAQPILHTIALSGTPAPTGGNYGAFSLSGTTQFPVINSNDRVFFNASLTGGSSQAGLFVGTSSAVQTVALQGGTSPSGGTYTVNFSDIVQNNIGQLAFSCSLVGSNNQGLYEGLPGALQTVAVTGGSAPGGGGNLYSNGFSTPLLNPSGVVAYSTSLTAGSSTTGLFVGIPGSVQAIALQGNPAPMGGNYSSFSTRALNSSGQVCFLANLSGGTSSSGIFLGTPGSLQSVALQGAPAPSGDNFIALSQPTLNNSGKVAFFGITTTGDGMFAGTPGSLQAVAFQGNPAPAGGNYSSTFGGIVLNGNGLVAFRADLIGGSSTSGIFVGLPGSLQAGALQGTIAPGGGNFSSFQTNTQLNGLGQIAFVANLSGSGVDSTNDQGLYAGTPDAITKIIRKGDLVDVDPGVGVDLRTVSGIGFRLFTNSAGEEDGRGYAFNDNGSITYLLTFTDGSSGVFYSSLLTVPEPSSILLILFVLCFGSLWWFRYGKQAMTNVINTDIEV